MLQRTRQQIHAQIVQIVPTQFPEIAETQPELLAYHATEAGLQSQAIEYWQQAGQHALERSAHIEALSHLSKGIALLERLPKTPERMQRELDFQTMRGLALVATRGYAAPEVEHAYARAQALCQQIGDTPQLFPVLVGLSDFYLGKGEPQTARTLAEKCLHLAQHLQDPALLMKAHEELAIPLFYLGEVRLAYEHAEQGLTRYDRQYHRSLSWLCGSDPGVGALCIVGWSLWMLGFPAQAVEKIEQALMLAQDLSHPYSLALALFCAARLYQFRREKEHAQERAEALIALSHEQGFTQWLVEGTMLRDGGLAVEEAREEFIAQLHQGLVSYRATGGRLGVPWYLARLAEAYREVRQIEEGLRMVAEALELIDMTEERWWEAELYRLKGELLVEKRADRRGKTGDSEHKVIGGRQVLSTEDATGSAPLEEIEICFQQALAIARRQQAKALELRAALSLSRLWHQQGKHTAARALLAENYSWFTEELDTADLQEVKTLLDRLP